MSILQWNHFHRLSVSRKLKPKARTKWGRDNVYVFLIKSEANIQR